MPIADLYESLVPSRTRAFSVDLDDAHRNLFREGVRSDEDDLIRVLNGWIGEHQPCFFGRIAAKRGLLRYCVLTERDLRSSDRDIREKIQRCREDWKAAAYDGQTSGFIVAAISPTLAHAEPSRELQEFSRQLCQEYLLEPVSDDSVYLERVHLERPGPARRTWAWKAGVNFFAAAGDGRWWRDHRFPGGVAFSVNSVGHMVKSTVLNNVFSGLDQAFGESFEGWAKGTNVDTLDMALFMAMRTIKSAGETPSGVATWLLPLMARNVGRCPTSLPKDLARFDPCEYRGFYNTDFTLPSEYFQPEVERPSRVPEHELDFSYLWDPTEADWISMGSGEPIRETSPRLDSSNEIKRGQMSPTESSVDDDAGLMKGLSRRGRN